MPILTLLLTLAAAGVILWAVNRFLPMDPKIKTLFGVVVIVVMVLVCLEAFGIFDMLRGVQVPRAHR